jgi:hypothetical protein
MKVNKPISKIDYLRTGYGSLPCRCYGTFINEIKRCAFLAIVLGVAAVLVTGCASTRGMVHAGQITPINTPVANTAADDLYQPARSPGFNELAGG